jgi:hypothetical protein
MLKKLFTRKKVPSEYKYTEEFVMWLYRRNHQFVLQPNNLWLNLDDNKRYPFEFVYAYWVKNIRK